MKSAHELARLDDGAWRVEGLRPDESITIRQAPVGYRFFVVAPGMFVVGGGQTLAEAQQRAWEWLEGRRWARFEIARGYQWAATHWQTLMWLSRGTEPER